MATPPTGSSPDRTLAYARAVVSGEIVAGPHVRNACHRHIADLARKDGIWFDFDAANHAFAFFEEVLIGTDNIAAGILLRSDMTVDEVMACYHDHVDHQGLARIAREAALTYGGSLPGTPAKISMDNRWTRSEYNDDRGKVGRNWADIGCRHPKDARNIFEKFESNHTVGFSVNWNKGSHKFAPCF